MNSFVIADLNVIQIDAENVASFSNCHWHNCIDMEIFDRNKCRDVMYSACLGYSENARGIWYRIWPQEEAFLSNPFFDIATTVSLGQVKKHFLKLRKSWKASVLSLISFFVNTSEHGCCVFVYLGNEMLDTDVEQLPLSSFLSRLEQGTLFFNKQYHVYSNGQNTRDGLSENSTGDGSVCCPNC